MAFLVPKHNVYTEIKKKTRELSLTYNKLLKLEEGVTALDPVPSKSSKTTQTSPKR